LFCRSAPEQRQFRKLFRAWAATLEPTDLACRNPPSQAVFCVPGFWLTNDINKILEPAALTLTRIDLPLLTKTDPPKFGGIVIG
jgi:hypothetical protein